MNKRMYLLFFAVVLVTVPLSVSLSFGQNYVIGDEDVLQIAVWGNQELNVQVPVRPDGMISFPLVGDIKASGFTPQELKLLLENELSKFVKTPSVSVIVMAINSFKVYVLGEGVMGASGTMSSGMTSGVITFRKNTTLLQMLAQLGSLKNADLNNAYLFREGKRLNNDFFKLIVKGDFSQDIQLKPNDVIFIPDNFDKRITVVGAVKTPSTIPYREELTVLDAVLAAGGFTEFASQNNVIVSRRAGDQVKNIEVRLKDVIKNGELEKNMLLKPGDYIIVKTGVF